MKRVLCSLALMILLAPALHAARLPDRAGSLAFEFSRSSQQTYEAARAAGLGGGAREELLLLRLFNVWSGSRLLFDLIEAPDTSVRRIEDTLVLHQVLVDETDDLLERTRGYESVKASWRDTKAALGLLNQQFGMRGGTVPAGNESTGDQDAARKEPEPEPVSPGFEARITATEWLGGFTPDLEVRGMFRGKNLVEARIRILESDGDQVWSDTAELTRQIESATSGFDKNEEVRVDWRIRVDDDDLASGQNRIVVTVKNGRGEEISAETTVKKRLF